MDIITPADVLGMSWARSLSGLAAALTRMPPCPIVQLTGAVPPPDGRDLLHLVRGVASIGGGTAHVFYAPMILARCRDGRRHPPSGRRRRRHGARAVGHDSDGRHRRVGARPVDDLRRVQSRGARRPSPGSASGRRWPGSFLGEDGRPVETRAGQPHDRDPRARRWRRSRASSPSPTASPRAPRSTRRSAPAWFTAWSRTPAWPVSCSGSRGPDRLRPVGRAGR